VVAIEENVFSAVNWRGDVAETIVGDGRTVLCTDSLLLPREDHLESAAGLTRHAFNEKQREVFELEGVKTVKSRLFLLPGTVQ
jgi:hypothetical protein